VYARSTREALMKRVISFFKTALVIGAVGATLAFGASQSLAGTRTKAMCPNPPNATCTSDTQCQSTCDQVFGQGNSTGSCRSGCCWCFL
jgi:hypothetical protein